jgi:ankyrin repeat domain-containing protein 17
MDPSLVRVLVKAGADPNRRAKNTDTKEVKTRRAAAARALWGSATAGRVTTLLGT